MGFEMNLGVGMGDEPEFEAAVCRIWFPELMGTNNEAEALLLDLDSLVFDKDTSRLAASIFA